MREVGERDEREVKLRTVALLWIASFLALISLGCFGFPVLYSLAVPSFDRPEFRAFPIFVVFTVISSVLCVVLLPAAIRLTLRLIGQRSPRPTGQQAESVGPIDRMWFSSRIGLVTLTWLVMFVSNARVLLLAAVPATLAVPLEWTCRHYGLARRARVGAATFWVGPLTVEAIVILWGVLPSPRSVIAGIVVFALCIITIPTSFVGWFMLLTGAAEGIASRR